MPPAEPGVRPLRIAVLSSLARDSGGHLRAFYIAKYLRAAGAEVRFYAGIRSLPAFIDYFVSAVMHARATFHDYDVVMAQKPLFNVAIPLLIQRARGRITVVDIDDDDTGFRGGVVTRVNAFLQRPLPRRCTLVTYHAETLPERIRSVFRVHPGRLFRLKQGVDLEVFARGGEHGRTAARDTPAEPVVAYAGHLNIASELEAVFRIVARARRDLPRLRLIVIGGGPLEQRFRRLALALGVADATTFTGHVAADTVCEHLRRATAGIVYYEPREANRYRESMKLREMLALGLPVVCNDFGELQQFEKWTYQASGRDAVAARLINLLVHGGDGRELAGMDYVRRELDWSLHALALHDRLVREVAAATSGHYPDAAPTASRGRQLSPRSAATGMP